MSESNEVVTEPTLERRTRRRFSAADKQHLLVEAEAEHVNVFPTLAGVIAG